MVFLCSCGGLIWENKVHVCGKNRCSCGGLQFEGRGHCCGYNPDYSKPPKNYELWRGLRSFDEWMGSRNWGNRSPSLFNTKNQEMGILNTASSMEEIKNLQQTGSFQDYSNAFDFLLTKVILSDDYATSLFVRGLKSEISCWVKFLRPKTLKEAYEAARKQDSFLTILYSNREIEKVGCQPASAKSDEEFCEVEIQTINESVNRFGVHENRDQDSCDSEDLKENDREISFSSRDLSSRKLIEGDDSKKNISEQVQSHLPFAELTATMEESVEPDKLIMHREQLCTGLSSSNQVSKPILQQSFDNTVGDNGDSELSYLPKSIQAKCALQMFEEMPKRVGNDIQELSIGHEIGNEIHEVVIGYESIENQRDNKNDPISIDFCNIHHEKRTLNEEMIIKIGKATDMIIDSSNLGTSKLSTMYKNTLVKVEDVVAMQDDESDDLNQLNQMKIKNVLIPLIGVSDDDDISGHLKVIFHGIITDIHSCVRFWKDTGWVCYLKCKVDETMLDDLISMGSFKDNHRYEVGSYFAAKISEVYSNLAYLFNSHMNQMKLEDFNNYMMLYADGLKMKPQAYVIDLVSGQIKSKYFSVLVENPYAYWVGVLMIKYMGNDPGTHFIFLKSKFWKPMIGPGTLFTTIVNWCCSTKKEKYMWHRWKAKLVCSM